MAKHFLKVELLVPYDKELAYLLDHPCERSDEVSLEIGLAGWSCEILDSEEIVKEGGRK